MISTEVLRRYPFFSFLDADQLRELAMITTEVAVGKGEKLFQIEDEADALYFLTDGSFELHYIVIDEHEPELRKEFLVGNINPGEILSISAVIEPHKLTATAIADSNSKLLRVDAEELRELCDEDQGLAYGLMKQIAKSTMERLQTTRIQLAAATAPLE
jgi:CRP-like cAMP-binding protein